MLAANLGSWLWNFHWDLVTPQLVIPSPSRQVGNVTLGSNFISDHMLARPSTVLYIHQKKLPSVPQKHSWFLAPPCPADWIPLPPSLWFASTSKHLLEFSSLPSVPKPRVSTPPMSPQHGIHHPTVFLFTGHSPSPDWGRRLCHLFASEDLVLGNSCWLKEEVLQELQ